ncbi:hypothetical protein B0H15DRAFT_739743, partial [Mycena belliarum]
KTPTPKQKRQPKAPARPIPAAAGTRDVSPPPWAVEFKSFLINTDFGEPWKALVGAWWSRESARGFEGGVKGHSAKKRPTAVGDWVARGRKNTSTTVIEDPDAFAASFQGWWVDINPTWRKKPWPMPRDRDGPWEFMDYCGKNGFLNVLIALKWWRNALPGGSKDWEAAVDDVTWVLGKM